MNPALMKNEINLKLCFNLVGVGEGFCFRALRRSSGEGQWVCHPGHGFAWLKQNEKEKIMRSAAGLVLPWEERRPEGE